MKKKNIKQLQDFLEPFLLKYDKLIWYARSKPVVAVSVVPEIPYTDEEIVFNDTVRRYPIVGDFIKETGLVFVSTLVPPREIEDKDIYLYNLAKELLSPERGYNREEVEVELERARRRLQRKERSEGLK
jgi:hypothetical protein